jgi:alpha-N-arabinofuranosidase
MCYTFGSTVYKSEEVALQPGSVDLKIEGSGGRFNFAYSQRGEFKKIDSVDARYLSTETVGGFTGVYVGFYATGNGKPGNAKAIFDYFEYIEN